jgi:hypothetical protein
LFGKRIISKKITYRVEAHSCSALKSIILYILEHDKGIPLLKEVFID